MKKQLALIVATGLWTPTSTLAQTEQPLEITVTANRFEVPVERTSHSVITVTRADIDRSGFKNLSEVLETIPGVYVARSGTLGSLTSTFIRGAESNHTVVMIDGVRVVTSNDGQAAIGQIPLSSVERVEVVKGGASTIYGADAIGGVINVITVKGSREPKGKAALTLGSNSSQQANISYQDQFNDTAISFGLSRDRTDGFDAKNTSADDRDGFERSSIFASATKTEDNLTLGITASAWRGDTEYDDGWYGDTQRFNSHLLALNATYYSDRNTYKLELARQFNATTEYTAGSPVSNGTKSKVINEEFNASVQSIISPLFTQVVGVNYRDEATENQGRNSKAIFWQGDIDFSKNILELGLRHEESSQYGSHNTWSAGIVRPFSDRGRVFANLRNSFSGATFLDLNPSYYTVAPDPAPETAKSAELGIEYAPLRNTRLELIAFDTRFKDKIAYDPVTQTMSNVSAAVSKGIEIGLEQNWDRAKLNLNYTLNKTEDSNGNRLLKRPLRQLGAKLSYELDSNLSVELGALHIGGLATSGTGNLISYTLWDSKLNYRVSDSFTLGVRLENMFDKEYTPLYGYNGRPRYLEATLNYTF